MWVRCKDPATGHEFDLDDRDARVRRGTVEVLKAYPANNGRRPRPTKHRVVLPKGRRTGTPRPKAEDSAPDTKETSNG